MTFAARKDMQAPAAGGEAAMRVLVVDDDPIYRETARMFLSMFGRATTLAESGQTALALARETDFDVMIVDFEMPGMTGLELISEIRRLPRHRDLPIIMVTSRDDAMAIDRAYELGASSFVVKPVNWTLLNHAMRFVRRAAENEIAARAAHAEAEAHSRTKDDLLAVVRHEMKTPLNAIIGFTRLAAEAQAGGDVAALREHLDFVRQSGERLLASFSDMMVYSDLLSQRGPFEPGTVPAKWIIGEVLEHRSRQAVSQGIVLISHGDGDEAMVQADQTLLASALVRLVDNALRHAEEATEIHLTVRRVEGGMIRFAVSDNGKGLEAARVAACLQPFSQANMSRARQSEGLGLGLPIATEIARRHGGRLDMESSPGRGTEVSVLVPSTSHPPART